MKWPAMTINGDKFRKAGMDLIVFFKTILLLMTGSAVFFIAFGIIGYLHAQYASEAPYSSMKGMAVSVPNQFFVDMIGMEMPHLSAEQQSFTFSQANVTEFLFTMLTDLNPDDPRTFLAREVPGMGHNRSIILNKGLGGIGSPVDYGPKQDVDIGHTLAEKGTITANPQFPVPQGPEFPGTTPDEAAPEQEPSSVPKKNIAFIYQTHNTESFLPELPGVTDPDKAFDPKTNITLVGLRLAQLLEEEGIGAVHSNKHYPAIEEDFKYHFSYKYSLKTLQEASTAHSDIKYYFDIHRDSQRRKNTTIELNGQPYAQVYFIIGGKNPNWKQNHQLAEQVHEVLEREYPGLSKGIYVKADGNGVYNQSFSPNALVIEVGGVDNTLEENYRTAEALSTAISEVINNVEKVNAPAEADKESA